MTWIAYPRNHNSYYLLVFSINSGFSFSHLFAAGPLTKLKIGKFHHQDMRERLIHWFLVPGAMPEAHKITTIPTVASALAMWTAPQWMALWKIEAGELFYLLSWTWWMVNISSFQSAMKALVPYAEFPILVTVRKFLMLLYSNCWSNVTIKVSFLDGLWFLSGPNLWPYIVTSESITKTILLRMKWWTEIEFILFWSFILSWIV